MSESVYGLPLPIPQPDSEFYWKKLKEHEVWLRKCDDCTATYFYPRDICPKCFSRQTSWIKSSGQGTLHSFVIAHRPPAPCFADRVPYVAALVSLEGDARVPTNLVDVAPDPEQVRIGMKVTAVFDDVTPDVTLLKFRPL